MSIFYVFPYQKLKQKKNHLKQRIIELIVTLARVESKPVPPHTNFN